VQDRPSATNLLATVSAFLRELMPRVEGADRFHARVSVHLLDIVQRELELGETFDESESRRLSGLLGVEGDVSELNRRLAAALRNGDVDYGDEAVFREVLRSVEDKLRIVNPGYLEDESS
jgi:hypothetical protein